ncbi:hypothetical protein NDI85_08190 [Halomicroarcula sp. S1AR25-4]|uniref:hypothetical protein n=1 Tax=Haloarcula sp. S1AR25-4 TaxID=2950538 RepID=UPI002874C6F8|nr:hypothetical protein [Halomicroarcula sp. S1AR25-4]MDS0277771.1 hypothetical protein [Halomicroarcula sp. S1AR25-4]
MRERLQGNLLGLTAAASVTLLCILVAGAGAIAIYAETVGTWRSLFLMEQALALLVPTVKALLAVAFVSGVGLVAGAR